MHLDDYTIARYLDNQIVGQEKQQVEAHLAGCPPCTEAVAAAYRVTQAVAAEVAPPLTGAMLQRAERLVVAPAPVSWLDRLLGTPLRLALTAVVVVSLGLVAYFGLLTPEQDRFRADPASRTIAATAPVDGAVIDESPLAFAWEALDDAVRYRLMLFTDEASVLWEGDAQESILVLPDSVRLRAGAQYLWRIDALLKDGSTIASTLHAFTMAP